MPDNHASLAQGSNSHADKSLAPVLNSRVANFRYVHRILDAAQVSDALQRAGLAAEIKPGGHKPPQPKQGHGRWQVNGDKFEVHSEYLSERSKTPDTLVI